jgi:hypothetical protein
MKPDAATRRLGDTAQTHPKQALPLLSHYVRRTRDGLTRCYVCGCSAIEPCNPPCGWAFDDVCTTCADAAAVIAIWRENAHAPKMSRLLAVSYRGLVPGRGGG